MKGKMKGARKVRKENLNKNIDSIEKNEWCLWGTSNVTELKKLLLLTKYFFWILHW